MLMKVKIMKKSNSNNYLDAELRRTLPLRQEKQGYQAKVE